MQSSQPPKPRRFDVSRRTNNLAGPKPHGPGFQREDKNMNTITTSSPRRATKGTTAPSRTKVGVQSRAPVSQSRLSSQKQGSAVAKSAKPKPKSARAFAATKIVPAAGPPPPPPSVLPVDPNCNEPSLPCLCCDGRSPQDNNSMFNHNHNNNNTISLRQQLQLPPPPAPMPQRQDGTGAKEQAQPQAQMELSACPAANLENVEKNSDENSELDNKKNAKVEEDDEEESSGDIEIDDEEEDNDDDDDEDDDTLVPSCCDCPPSLLEFSLSSSTSSSSTSISSCSDLESDCADQSASICSSQDQDNLSISLSSRDHSLPQGPESQPPARSPPSLPLNQNPFSLTSHSPSSPCSPDEGYPSALDSPSPDYLGVKGDSDVTKLGLLDFLESVGEFGKMERFSQVIQVAHWDLEGEQQWDVLRDRLDHLDRLEKVNREVKLSYINISRETTSMAVSTSPTLSTFSPNSSSPTFTTFRCEKSLPSSPPSIPPLPASKPVPYLTLYTTPSPPPSIPTPTPPIPPPRKRHLARDRWIDTEKLDGDRKADMAEEGKKKEESRDTQRTTSFTEMARRRKKNTGLAFDQYYSTSLSNTHEAKAKNMSFEASRFSAESPETPPPPPPPRPLPPIPPSLPSVKVSTLPANSEQPERFDWLIAFTPECEAPPQQPPLEKRKSLIETPKKPSSSGTSPRSAPKVTTFKELRFRNKSASPPTKVITEPDPDPTVITPDPDILYNLKWRKQKEGSDGSQWEYTSQAQALFMQPPPALTSMAALQEMLQRADKEGEQLELCPSQKIGCSISDSSLWTLDREWEGEEIKKEEKEGKDEQKEVEVRGQADGGWTFESRNTVSSPPLSLAQSSQPYFLHTAVPSFRPGYCYSHPLADPRPRSHVGQEPTDTHCTTRWTPAASSAYSHRDESSSVISSGFNDESLVDFGVESPRDYGDKFKQSTRSAYQYNSDPKTSETDFATDSICNFDSLYGSDSERQNDAHTASEAPVSSTNEAPGCTTPYKNIDVMLMYSNSRSAMDSLYSEKRSHSQSDQDSIKARASKELPPLPTCYLYHPKNCPLHRGAPPRLSPIGALSPPHRSGAPPPGAGSSSLSSPLFPRSHTLPALAAPLYYPNLYPPIPPRAPPLPPKLYQAPLQSRVAMSLSAVRSVSFAGSVQKTETPWMGEDVKHPMRGLGLSSLCLQEKKALVGAVSVAVEAILAQFSSSRTVVQKSLSVNRALSGDSAINPSLGRLVLQCLCPALHSLLTDGLKPYQSDLIAGRRPNSAWSLVQASTRAGPKTHALFNLQVRVGELPHLRQSKHRFNAFLLGLLNTKLLDFWLSHLQSCSDVLETYYHPTSFMRLSLTACQPLFEELLLVLQPLSLLTFNLDLLFQHHHLEPESHRPEIPSPPFLDSGFQLSIKETAIKGSQSKIPGSRYTESLSEVHFGNPDHQAAKDAKSSPLANSENGGSGASTDTHAGPIKASVTLGETSPQLLWVQEKEIEDLPPPDVEEDSLAQQAGQVIQQGWGAVVRWGGRLSQNLAELSLSAVKKDEVKTDLPDLQAQAGSDYSPVSGGTQVPWGLGRLFGASKTPSSPTDHTLPTRRPSQWFAPGVTALTRIVSSSSTPILRRAPEPPGETGSESEKDVDTLEMKDKPRPLRSVRTLCDHAGSGSELSFRKGEELVVLGGVDQDWIRCRQGDKEGLVPIGYTSLIM
ncbi:uncharacterized protein rusc1 [Archocentrus centrarchus]|uniref:uncharacterized protein rusc1 n=1 Tax=Archocentrus centrarchus TaxID=63155 RepID=UPI0011E9B8DE|nr:RUN and SH3 domain-containing protein 1 [Archocentrus centrarchus]